VSERVLLYTWQVFLGTICTCCVAKPTVSLMDKREAGRGREGCADGERSTSAGFASTFADRGYSSPVCFTNRVLENWVFFGLRCRLAFSGARKVIFYRWFSICGAEGLAPFDNLLPSVAYAGIDRGVLYRRGASRADPSCPLLPLLSSSSPLNQLGGLRSAVSSPAWFGAAPWSQTNLLHSKAVRKPLVVIVLSILTGMFYQIRPLLRG